jgi:hypothetical protein
LVDTINELFSGDRDFFKNLWIGSDEAGYDFKKHPVIRLNMVLPEMGSANELKQSIFSELKPIAIKEGVEITSTSYAKTLEELITGLYEKYNKTGVVVLIDEYDAPITTNIGDYTLAEANAEVLHNFYTMLKKNITYLRFVFVTGITRFAFTVLDSGANNFLDISLDPNFSGICGFTISEFDALFHDQMEALLAAMKISGWMEPDSQVSDLRQEIMDWYDGYNWGERTKYSTPIPFFISLMIINFFLFGL